MVVKAKRKPKVQRGVSVTPELYEAIQKDAAKLGITWNETAELVLAKAFLSSSDSNNQAGHANNVRDAEDEEVRLDA